MNVKLLIQTRAQKLYDEYMEMDRPYRILFAIIVVAGSLAIVANIIINSKDNKPAPNLQPTVPVGPAAAGNLQPPSETPSNTAPGNPAFNRRVLPTTPRNQGLEDLVAEIKDVKELLGRLQRENEQLKAGQPGRPSTTQDGVRPSGTTKAVDLDAALPRNGDSVVFDDVTPPMRGTSGKPIAAAANPDNYSAPARRNPRMQLSDAEAVAEVAATEGRPAPAVVVNSGIEAIMLTGVNARQAGAGAQATMGSVTTANNVGAPFVTKLKGDVVLPNGWRLSDLGDCFLGGSAVAVISAGRAYATAENLSCVGESGDIWEAPVKAYAVDIDGTLGIAGHVVSKQGTLLQQAALTGIVGGIAQAFSPTAVPTYSQTTGTTTQPALLPNPGLVGRTAVGGGFNAAQQQLSRFYMEYAREIFPVVEVPAATRVTWIFKETIELKKRKFQGEKGK